MKGQVKRKRSVLHDAGLPAVRVPAWLLERLQGEAQRDAKSVTQVIRDRLVASVRRDEVSAR